MSTVQCATLRLLVHIWTWWVVGSEDPLGPPVTRPQSFSHVKGIDIQDHQFTIQLLAQGATWFMIGPPCLPVTTLPCRSRSLGGVSFSSPHFLGAVKITSST